MFGFLLRRRLREVGLLRREIADQQVEPAVAVPIDRTDLGANPAARLLGSALFARRYELHPRRQLGNLAGADVAVEPDAAIARPNQQVELAVAVPVADERPGIAVDVQRPAPGRQ